jgi:hypothetical protein
MNVRISDYVLPVGVLVIISLIAVLFWLAQVVVFIGVSYGNSEVVWRGECEVVELYSNKDVTLRLDCNGEEVETADQDVVVAWANHLTRPTCEKSELWNQDDHAWNCSVGED